MPRYVCSHSIRIRQPFWRHYGLRISRAASKVNEIQEAVKYQYDKVEIDMPVFMDDIAAVGTVDNIRKGIYNWRRMEVKKKRYMDQ